MSHRVAWLALLLASAVAQTPPPANGSLPVVSPDGKYIVFTGERDGQEDIYVIKPDGSGEHRLTKTPEVEGNLAWSRDGKVLYSTFDKNTNLSTFYAMDRDGQHRRELARVPGRGPVLSPDGKHLLYMAGDWRNTKLMLGDRDGSNAKQITDGTSNAWNTHFSPDGKRIAYTGTDPATKELAIVVMNIDGSAPRVVTHFSHDDGRAQGPVWSPDGKRIAVQANSNTQEHSAHIWVVDIATGAATKLTAHTEPWLDETPFWFPDAKHIAFQSNRNGRMEVWTMNADGTGLKQVTGLKH